MLLLVVPPMLLAAASSKEERPVTFRVFVPNNATILVGTHSNVGAGGGASLAGTETTYEIYAVCLAPADYQRTPITGESYSVVLFVLSPFLRYMMKRVPAGYSSLPLSTLMVPPHSSTIFFTK